MFWTENHTVSLSINTLLEKQDVTLKELLNEEDILQECNAANKNLVKFLIQPNIIYELIQLIVEEPPDNVDMRLKYKYCYLASEVIASRVPSLIDTVAKKHRIMRKLYSFLDGKPPLNPLLASYFAKAIDVLFSQSSGLQDWYTYQFRYFHVAEYFKSHSDFLLRFLNHIGTSGVLNAFQHITQFTDNDININILTWLDSQQLIEKLIALICGTYTPLLYICETTLDISDEDSDVAEQSNNNTANVNNDTQSAQHNLLDNGDKPSPPSETTDPEHSNHSIKEHHDTNTELPNNLESCVSESTDMHENDSPQENTPDSVEKQTKEDPIENEGVDQSEVEHDGKEESNDSSVQPEPTIVETDQSEHAVTNGPVDKLLDYDDCLNDEKYIEILESSRSVNASQLMCYYISQGRDNVRQKSYNPLYSKCISEETVTSLLNCVFSSPPSKRKFALMNGIQVLLVLLNDKTGVVKPPEIPPEELNRITDAILPFVPNFVDVLKNPPEGKKVPYNISRKTVGTVRLSVAHLFMVLVETLSDSLALKLIEHDVFNLLLDMFFEYDFNNFLHSSVETIVCTALKAFIGTDISIFRDHFFYHCKLLERLDEGWTKGETPSTTRPGYMGHLIQMVTVINDFNMYTCLQGPQAEVWEQLKSKLLRAMANQNLALATIHHDNDECLLATIHNDIDDSHQVINNDDDDDDKINQHHPIDTMMKFWSHPYNMFDEDGLSGASVFDANSSPWGDSSDDDLQSGWADFGNLQETAGISTVPNTFTCESFAASQNVDFDLCNNTDKFIDDFADFRISDSNIPRLEQIQADTAITSTMVFQMPPSEDAMHPDQFSCVSSEIGHQLLQDDPPTLAVAENANFIEDKPIAVSASPETEKSGGQVVNDSSHSTEDVNETCNVCEGEGDQR